MIDSILSFVPRLDLCAQAFVAGATARILFLLISAYVFIPSRSKFRDLLTSTIAGIGGWSLGLFTSGSTISGDTPFIVLARFVSVIAI